MENNKTGVFSNKIVVAIIVLIALMTLFVVVFLVRPYKNGTLVTSDGNELLSDQLKKEQAEIMAAFDRRFQFLNGQYEIKKTILLDKGDYAMVLLEIENVEYRSVLTKENDGWSVVGIPDLVLEYDNYEDVPEEIIRTINDYELKRSG